MSSSTQQFDLVRKAIDHVKWKFTVLYLACDNLLDRLYVGVDMCFFAIQKRIGCIVRYLKNFRARCSYSSAPRSFRRMDLAHLGYHCLVFCA